ncbi:MAG: hypothetical protein AAF502_18970 [Bacteroidota bacterium]
MKKIYFFLFSLLMISYNAQSQSVLELGPSQSMSIAGKGPGQDAAINPYMDGNSIAIVENIGKNNFEIRIQNKGKIVKIESIPPGESKTLDLLKGYELYFDSELKATAKVDFKKSDG